MPKITRMKPTKALRTFSSAEGRNTFAKLPIAETKVKKIIVDITAPIPKRYMADLFICSSTILVENTPAQNTIVKGFESVKIKAFKNMLLALCFDKKFTLGMIEIPNMPKIVLTPNPMRTIAPKYLIVFLKFL